MNDVCCEWCDLYLIMSPGLFLLNILSFKELPCAPQGYFFVCLCVHACIRVRVCACVCAFVCLNYFWLIHIWGYQTSIISWPGYVASGVGWPCAGLLGLRRPQAVSRGICCRASVKTYTYSLFEPSISLHSEHGTNKQWICSIHRIKGFPWFI